MDLSLTIAGKFLSVWDSNSSGSTSIPTSSICFSTFSILRLKSLTRPDFLFLQPNSADPDTRLRLVSNPGSFPAFREFFNNLGIYLGFTLRSAVIFKTTNFKVLRLLDERQATKPKSFYRTFFIQHRRPSRWTPNEKMVSVKDDKIL